MPYEFHPFSLGNVIGQGENILNARHARDPNSLNNQYRRAQLNALNNPGGDPTAPMRNYAERQRMVEAGASEEELARFDNYVRAMQIKNLGGIETIVSPGGTNNTPLSSLQNEMLGESSIRGAGAYATESEKMRAQAGFDAPVAPSELNLGVQQAAAQPAEKPVTAASLAADKAEQVAMAKETATVNAEYTRMKSNMPGLIKNVAKLKKLSEKATYTLAGKGRDIVSRETGFGATEGAVARADMIATVDNQVLPLLRDTFGAAFTKAEGDTLRAALVNPDATHEERMAQLNAFIAQKEASLEAKRMQLGKEPPKDDDPLGIRQ